MMRQTIHPKDVPELAAALRGLKIRGASFQEASDAFHDFAAHNGRPVASLLESYGLPATAAWSDIVEDYLRPIWASI